MGSRDYGGGKLPGKAAYSGRRRTATRRSGFKSHPDATGGEFRTEDVPTFELTKGQVVTVTFEIAPVEHGEWVGFGGWFNYEGDLSIEVRGGPRRRTLSTHGPGVWNKVGALWRPDEPALVQVELVFSANEDCSLAIYEMDAGHVHHDHLATARDGLLGNMYSFAPEANFYVGGKGADVTSDLPDDPSGTASIALKSCNRCARYLPINTPPNERSHLSFSNHCVAAHRRPCRHGGFGLLKGANGATLDLDFGYQLECRFCKKFEVNAAHNPKRTAAQMKEDGARRRALEFLLEALYEGTPQLLYRHATGRELVDDVWERFDGRCFKCKQPLKSKKKMHLDHTRPLKLLWPLDGTATALCATHNSEKRDRPPVDFYSDAELEELAEITGCSLEELRSPEPNIEALELLVGRLDWFFGEFLTKPEMVIVRDGKVTGELVVKALQKVIAAAGVGDWPDLEAEYESRRFARVPLLAADGDER